MLHWVFLHCLVITAQCLPLENSDYGRGGADLAHLGSSVFGKPSKESGRRVQEWNEESEVNPEELGEYIEGDILFPSKLSKNGLIAETARWPGGEIPFEITGHFSGQERDLIKRAMQKYHALTCIRFRHRENTDPDWISITSSNTGCWSSVGRTGGRQDVNLQSPGCLAKIGTVMHELLHAAGFQHEQNRWERDSFVTIHWQNILKGRENNFKKATRDSVSGFGVPYDYGSVMHYSEKAFSKNGERTISMLQNQGIKIGQREGFSEKDLQKIRRMYSCPVTKDNNTDVDSGISNPDDGNHNNGLIDGLISVLFP